MSEKNFFTLPELPVFTTIQRDALIAKDTMYIYNSTTKTIQYYNGTTWINMSANGVCCLICNEKLTLIY